MSPLGDPNPPSIRNPSPVTPFTIVISNTPSSGSESVCSESVTTEK
jgi:hypothetical protein